MRLGRGRSGERLDDEFEEYAHACGGSANSNDPLTQLRSPKRLSLWRSLKPRASPTLSVFSRARRRSRRPWARNPGAQHEMTLGVMIDGRSHRIVRIMP
jgi:hypothetical protein